MKSTSTGAGAERAPPQASRIRPADSPPPPPQRRNQPAHRPPQLRGSEEKAGNRATSSLAPSLNASVLHLLCPGCGLLNHWPRNPGSRESGATAAKRRAEGLEKERGESAGPSPACAEPGALAARPPVLAPRSCAQPSPGAPGAIRAGLRAGLEVAAPPGCDSSREQRRSWRARLPRSGLSERSARAPGVPRVAGHPNSPPGGAGDSPQLPRNELSTVALGAARGPIRIRPGAANPEAGRPWRNGGTMERGVYEVWGIPLDPSPPYPTWASPPAG